MTARLLGGVLCVLSAASCGGEMLRTGRSPVFLTVLSTTGTSGNGGSPSSFLASDVQVLVDQTVNGQTVKVPTIFNDVASVTLRVDSKDPTLTTTTINAVTLTRYRVDFHRADGRNVAGVDVPFGFDGGLGQTIDAGGSGTISFDIIRHQAKLEPPLRNLVNTGGAGFISAIATITIYGRDQNGNELMATANLDVQFGDFGDS
jgi:hypothetical protein